MIKLYDVAEVSAMLKLSKSCVYKLAERKSIGSLKIGSTLRFNDAHIQKFLEDCASHSQSDLKDVHNA
jgi:excisionase family DNA binding protein